MRTRIEPSTEARLAELLVKTSRTFALSIPQLPEPTRREVTVAYLLFRIADTLEDATEWTQPHQLEQLDRMRELLSSLSAAEACRVARAWTDHPPLRDPSYLELLGETPLVLDALGALSDEAGDLVSRHTTRTVERMIEFVRRPRPLELRDVEDLRAYCYAVAGIVGEMLTALFLLGHPALARVRGELERRAARFGEALQLVNILKDSASDVLEGRGYLPSAVGREPIFNLARDDLRAAGQYVCLLQEAGAPAGLVAFTALPVRLAWMTLDRVEQRGPGSKLSRPEVATMVVSLDEALAQGRPAVPESQR